MLTFLRFKKDWKLGLKINFLIWKKTLLEFTTGIIQLFPSSHWLSSRQNPELSLVTSRAFKHPEYKISSVWAKQIWVEFSSGQQLSDIEKCSLSTVSWQKPVCELSRIFLTAVMKDANFKSSVFILVIMSPTIRPASPLKWKF